LVLTAITAALVGLMRGRQQRLEEEVRVRTETLRASEASYRRQFSDSLAVMFLFDPVDGRIVEANTAGILFYGYTAEQFHSMRIMDISTQPKAEVDRVMQSVLNETGSHFELRHRLADGTVRDVEVYSSAIWFGNRRLIHSIVHDITERKRAEADLERASRQAGMAEVATSILHNIGNVLNSVNVSIGVLHERARDSGAEDVAKVAGLLESHREGLLEFLGQEDRAAQLTQYLSALAPHLASQQASDLAELQELAKNVDHIKDVVARQQSYAKLAGATEWVSVADLVEDALAMDARALARHEVQVVRDYDPAVPKIALEKHKLLQILVNLIHNAKYACDGSERLNKRLTVRVSNRGGKVRVTVADNGVGIPAENLKRIFNHGFTTRKNGHGFGLHSAALAARELGGALLVHSDGPGQGAAFTVELPLPPQERAL
jgi:PAS domain S-box-containing protein